MEAEVEQYVTRMWELLCRKKDVTTIPEYHGKVLAVGEMLSKQKDETAKSALCILHGLKVLGQHTTHDFTTVHPEIDDFQATFNEWLE